MDANHGGNSHGDHKETVDSVIHDSEDPEVTTDGDLVDDGLQDIKDSGDKASRDNGDKDPKVSGNRDHKDSGDRDHKDSGVNLRDSGDSNKVVEDNLKCLKPTGHPRTLGDGIRANGITRGYHRVEPTFVDKTFPSESEANLIDQLI